MSITSNMILNYLFNYLIIFLIIFASTLICDIIDTLKHKTEIQVFASMIESFFCSILLGLLCVFVKLPDIAIFILCILSGANSYVIYYFIKRKFFGKGLIDTTIQLIPIESVRDALDDDNTTNEDNNKKNKTK